MHEIRVAELELRNFKGVRAFTLEPQGLDISVLGDNATGKTTLEDAFSWLFFDVDSAGRADFDIKTLDGAGDPIHNLEHEVRAVLILTGNVRIELRKVYKEVWTKRRGEAQKTFTGHTTDHYIDGVPVKKAEYAARLTELADLDLNGFRLLTDPVHFSERLHWQERRALVLEIGGDITDEDVIASNPELEELPEITGKRSLEDTRKVLAARKREVNKELERIPVRIDEVRRAIPEDVDEPLEDIRIELATAREALAELERERASTADGGAVAAATEALALARARLVDAKSAARQEAGAATEELEAEVRVYRSTVKTLEAELKRCEEELGAAQARLEELGKRREELRARWDAVDSEDYPERGEEYGDEDDVIIELAELLEAAKADPEGECPTCHQPLPESMVEAASGRALERFNTAKGKALERITEAGKATAAAIEALEADIPDLEHARDKAAEDLEAAEAVRDEAAARLEAASTAPQEPQTSAAVDEAAEAVRAAEAAQETAKQGVSMLLAKLDERIRAARSQVEELGKRVAAGEAAEKAESRVHELESQEANLGNELGRIEHALHLLEMFTRAKVDLLTERINAKFRRASFRLFRELVNGALEECCETLCDGVPWASANHGARIQVGMDIIRTLQAHYGIAPPVWVDQSESVTTLPEMDCQLIRLVVSADDAKLRVITNVTAPATPAPVSK